MPTSSGSFLFHHGLNGFFLGRYVSKWIRYNTDKPSACLRMDDGATLVHSERSEVSQNEPSDSIVQCKKSPGYNDQGICNQTSG